MLKLIKTRSKLELDLTQLEYLKLQILLKIILLRNLLSLIKYPTLLSLLQHYKTVSSDK